MSLIDHFVKHAWMHLAKEAPKWTHEANKKLDEAAKKREKRYYDEQNAETEAYIRRMRENAERGIIELD